MLIKVIKYIVNKNDPEFVIWDDYFIENGYQEIEETKHSVIYSKKEILEGHFLERKEE